MSFDILMPDYDPFANCLPTSSSNDDVPSQFPSDFSDLSTISGFSDSSAPMTVSDIDPDQKSSQAGSMDFSYSSRPKFDNRTGMDGALPPISTVQIPNLSSLFGVKRDPFDSQMSDEYENAALFPPSFRMTPTTSSSASASTTSSDFSFIPSMPPPNLAPPLSPTHVGKRRKHSRNGDLIPPKNSLEPFLNCDQKNQMEIETAAQMEIQKLEQRRKSGTLCLGNFLFGCTADRPKTKTVRPFGRCMLCLSGKVVPLLRTRMTIFPQFPKEKGQTLIPGSRDRQAVRGQRFKKIFGNWNLIVFPTVQDAEEATLILGHINGYPALVYTADVLPKNVWANGIPFIRSAKINKMIPKPIDTSSVIREEDIIEPELRAHELSRNIANWQPLSIPQSTRALLLKKELLHHSSSLPSLPGVPKLESTISSDSLPSLINPPTDGDEKMHDDDDQDGRINENSHPINISNGDVKVMRSHQRQHQRQHQHQRQRQHQRHRDDPSGRNTENFLLPPHPLKKVTRRILPPMHGECECGSSTCDHDFNPNIWRLPEILPHVGPVRWVKCNDVNVSTPPRPGTTYLVKFLIPGRTLTTESMFVNSLYGRRFEFLVPVPPPELIAPLSGPLKVVVYFSDATTQTSVEIEPFTYIIPLTVQPARMEDQ